MAFMNKIGSMIKQTSSKLPGFESPTSSLSIYQAIRSFSSAKLFVGGISFATDENSLREAFIPYGEVVEARIIVDRESGRSRGFGFVSYASTEQASTAIQALDGRDLHGRFIRVAYAADQRGTNRGSRFPGPGGPGSSFRENADYGSADSQNGGNYGTGNSNYGASGNYNPYGSFGGGNFGDQSGSSYGNPNFGNATAGYPTETNQYGSHVNMNYASGDNFGVQHASNRAGEDYGHVAGTNFGGNHADSYVNASGGGRFQNGGYENIGNFSGGNVGNISNYNDSQIPYDSHDRDESRVNLTDNSFSKDDNHSYSNARVG